MIDWNDLRYFLAIARSGSTAAAGRQLGVNQSTVVRRLAALEAGLGLRLFEKQRQGYRLTAEGEALVANAGSVETAVLELTRRAAALDSTLTGSLRVSAVALGLVPRLIREFERHHPDIKVSLMIEERYADLGAGEADVALRAGPPGSSTLVGRKLSDQTWAVYATGDYVERHGAPATPDDLNAHRVIGFEGVIEDITAARWLREVAPRCEITTRSNSVLGLLQAAKAGFGLALLPCQIGDPEDDLVRVLDPQTGLTGGLWILTHPDLHKRPKVRVFFDFMAQAIVKHRPLLLGQTRPLRGTGPALPPPAREPATEGPPDARPGSDL